MIMKLIRIFINIKKYSQIINSNKNLDFIMNKKMKIKCKNVQILVQI